MPDEIINPAASPAPVSDSPAVAPGQDQVSATDSTVGQVPASPENPNQDSSPEQLAAAEQRVKDTQRWGHTLAQENAKLRTELTAIFNHPIYGGLLKAGLEPADSGGAVDDGVKQAWKEYQSAANDEEAFAKLLTFAEERASRKALTKVQQDLAARETQARLQQRNALAAQTINKTVTQVAPDVPIELFWAMSQRAELETPPEIQHYTDRLSWQVNRAIELSRSVLTPARDAARAAGAQSAAANRAVGAVMAPGGVTPGVTPGVSPDRPKTLVETIREMQMPRR